MQGSATLSSLRDWHTIPPDAVGYPALGGSWTFGLRGPGHLDSRIMPADPSATLAAVAERELQALRDAPERLPARQRLIVSLFEIDGVGTGEVAERLGVSQVTVRAE
jgi:RNA polymerase sigma factor (sigma-70 family)